MEVRYGEGGGTEPYHHVVNVREHLPRRRQRVAPPSPQERRSKRAHTFRQARKQEGDRKEGSAGLENSHGGWGAARMNRRFMPTRRACTQCGRQSLRPFALLLLARELQLLHTSGVPEVSCQN